MKLVKEMIKGNRPRIEPQKFLTMAYGPIGQKKLKFFFFFFYFTLIFFFSRVGGGMAPTGPPSLRHCSHKPSGSFTGVGVLILYNNGILILCKLSWDSHKGVGMTEALGVLNRLLITHVMHIKL
jgi:hypothetical protein